MISAAALEISFSEKGLAQVSGAIRQMGGEVDRAGQKGRGFFSNMLSTAGGVVVANTIGLITRNIVGLGQSLLMANANAETWRNSLNIAVGDMREAGELFTWLQQFAAKTPFEFPELIQAAVRLEGFGVSSKAILTTLGDTAAAMNRPLEQITEAWLDLGVGQYRRMQELGVDVADLGDTVRLRWFENGVLMEKIVEDSGIAVQNAVTDIWSKYNGAMDTQSKTFLGRWSTFKDNAKLLAQELTLGMFNIAKSGLELANDWFALFADFRAEGMDPMTAAFAAVQTVVAETFGPTAARRVTRFMDALLVSGRAIGRGFRDVMDIAGRLREAIGVNGLSGAFAIAATELNRFLPDDLTAILISASQLVANLTGNLFDLGSAVISGDFAGMWESFKTTVTDLVSDGIDVGEIVINGIVSLGGALADVAGNLWAWVTRQIMGGTVGGELALLGASAGGIAGQLGGGGGQTGGSHSIPIGTVIMTGLARLGGELADIPGDLNGWIREKLGLTGRLDATTGDMTGGGGYADISLGDVILDGIAKIGASLKRVANNLSGWIKEQLGAGPNGMGPGDGTGGPGVPVSLGTVLIDGVLRLGRTLAAWAGRLWEWVRSQLVGPNVPGTSGTLGQAFSLGGTAGSTSVGEFLIDGTLKLAGALAEAAQDFGSWIRGKLTESDISIDDFTDWKLHLGVPGEGGITVDGDKLSQAVVDNILESLGPEGVQISVTPEQEARAESRGERLGHWLMNTLIDNAAAAVGRGGGGGGGDGQTPARDVLANAVINVFEGMFDEVMERLFIGETALVGTGGLGDTVVRMPGPIQQLSDSILGWFQDMADTLTGAIPDINWGGIGDAIGGAIGGIFDAIPMPSIPDWLSLLAQGDVWGAIRAITSGGGGASGPTMGSTVGIPLPTQGAMPPWMDDIFLEALAAKPTVTSSAEEQVAALLARIGQPGGLGRPEPEAGPAPSAQPFASLSATAGKDVTEALRRIVNDVQRGVGSDLAAAVRQANPERTILDPFRNSAAGIRPLMAAFEQNVVSRMQGTRVGAAAQMLQMQRANDSMFAAMVSRAASAMGDFSARINTALAVVAISASGQGFNIGAAIGNGAAAGVRATAGRVAAEAAAMVNQAIFMAQLAALAFSPSKKMMVLGDDLVDGLLIPLRQRRYEAGVAMASLIDIRPKVGGAPAFAGNGSFSRGGDSHTTYQTNYIEGHFAEGQNWRRQMNDLSATRARSGVRG